MPIFTPLHYLTFAFSGAILYFYQSHYRVSLVYFGGLRNYFATVGFGLAAVGLALGLQILLHTLGFEENLINKAFLYSAFTEEFAKCLVLLLVLWSSKIDEVLYDGVFYGVVLGGTFGFAENLIYAQGQHFWHMILRAITASILHLLNGGIAGYFCMKFLFTKEIYKYKYLIEGFILCYISHAIYNYAALTGGAYLMLLPPLLVYNFILVEFISAYAQSCLPKYTLDLIQLSIQDYELIRRHTKYEHWLHNEQNVEKKYTYLFQNVEFQKKLYILFALIISLGFIFLSLVFPEKQTSLFKEISIYEYVSIFIIYPLVIAVSVFFAGLINPEFFQKQILRVPLISVLDVKCKDHQETAILFFISTYGFYAPLLNPEKLQGELELNFLIGTKEFKNRKGRVIWINKTKPEYNNAKYRVSISGALIRFNRFPFDLILYWKWARFKHRFRNFKKSMESLND